MEGFFQITPLETVFAWRQQFAVKDSGTVSLFDAPGRILSRDITPDAEYPDFNRATMDGFAVKAEATFGASEANPVYLTVTANISMGEVPSGAVGAGEAMGISTGGMLPEGADTVVMREYATWIDQGTIEVVHSAAPRANIITAGEDMAAGSVLLPRGKKIRAQDCGALAALGINPVPVFQKPAVGIISTGDEIVPVDQSPGTGQIRDVNTYTLAAMIENAGGTVRTYGIIADDAEKLRRTCAHALQEVDIVLISGGSSVGTRDMTIEAISALPDAEVLVHGIPLSPGKPTIMARSGKIQIWGLPGQITSAMVVFDRVVRPFIEHMGGQDIAPGGLDIRVPALLTRNIASATGRTDFVRARLTKSENGWNADPILGKSGLINTMLRADGLIEIDKNTEGMEKGSIVHFILFR
ncbi:MAG: molybdopterin molybdotransferase MoeA [Desulfosalsimonadaceae bacterium]